MNPIRLCIGRVWFAILLVFSLPLPLFAAPTTPPHPASLTADTPAFSTPSAHIEHITQALHGAEPLSQIRLLLQRGEAWRTLWMHHNAHADFSQARALAHTLSPAEPLLEITALHGMAAIELLMQQPEQAQTHLQMALTLLQAPLPQDHPAASALAVKLMTHLGNALAAQARHTEALAYYQQALAHLETSTPPHPALSYATVYRNRAEVQPQAADALRDLRTALDYAQAVETPTEQARLFISIATAWGHIDPSADSDGPRYHLLRRALDLGEELSDANLIAVASGRLGALYEQRNRITEASLLTQQALSAARTVNRDDLLLQWEWQWGRLLQAQGQRRQAIDAHRRALFHIDALRQDLPFGGRQGCVSFQHSLQPVAMGLADLLLQESASQAEASAEQRLLRQAQQAIETAKQSELRDYFRDPCIDAMTQPVEQLSAQTAVLYPIILPDRLELLADIGGRLHRRSAAVNATVLEQTVAQYAHALRHGGDDKPQGEQLYRWMIAPFSALLSAQQVDTLIFLPDGALRTIPAAALWTGETYLAQHYALVTAPGLTLLNPEPLPAETQRNTLLAGVSEPGAVVHELPASLQQQLLYTDVLTMDRTVRGAPLQMLQPIVVAAPEASPLPSQDMLASYLQALLYLPGVAQEIQQLEQTLPSQTLFNLSFSRERFAREMQLQDYRIVHIASHGFFGGRPEENFIMAHDKLIDMNHLESYIKPKQFAKQPVELLTLSACQTAEGDDRSPLGLSGMALKSGARSVLGSLWPVSDDATQHLLASFYRHLNTPNTTKAAALQQAQRELIDHPELQHPFYWSAFILSGNWL